MGGTMSEPELNPAVVGAIESLHEPMPNPVTHGQFNRRMFLEAIVIKGGQGVSMEKDDIIAIAGMTEQEFVKIKDEYVKKGVITEKPNLFKVVMYSLNYEGSKA
jgi:hypothetical protein